MKMKWRITKALFALWASAPLFAANAPIQRIDITNLLGAGGATPTSVSVSLSNGVSTPCYSSTLPYLGSITIWVGAGQVCTTPVTAVTIVPTGSNLVYGPPSNPHSISGTQYLSQISVTQNTPPMFDPTNGSLLSLGTVQVNVTSNLSGH